MGQTSSISLPGPIPSSGRYNGYPGWLLPRPKLPSEAQKCRRCSGFHDYYTVCSQANSPRGKSNTTKPAPFRRAATARELPVTRPNEERLRRFSSHSHDHPLTPTCPSISLPPSYRSTPEPGNYLYSGSRGPPMYNDVFGDGLGSSRYSSCEAINAMKSAQSARSSDGFRPSAPPMYSSNASLHRAVQPSAPPEYRSQSDLDIDSSALGSDSDSNEAELRTWFSTIDELREGHISIDKLRQTMINRDITPFGTDMMEMLLLMFDKDSHDEIQFAEFVDWIRIIQKWKYVFDRMDMGRAGVLDVVQIRRAFSAFGFHFSQEFCMVLCHRFAHDGHYMNVDAFIFACATVIVFSRKWLKSDQSAQLDAYLDQRIGQSRLAEED